MISQERKTQFGLKLDDAIIDCFSTLSPQCRDEEFEDLVYFVLDLYQLHGIPVALSEVDIDRVSTFVGSLSFKLIVMCRLSLTSDQHSKNTMLEDVEKCTHRKTTISFWCLTRMFKACHGNQYQHYVVALSVVYHLYLSLSTAWSW